MGALEDILLGSLGSEKDYLQDSPWYNVGANILRAPTPEPTSNLEAILFPALQGGLGGWAIGAGKRSALEDALGSYKPQIEALTGTAYTPGEDWSIRRGQKDLALALLENEAERQVSLEKLKATGDLAKTLAGQGKMTTPNGEIRVIPGAVEAQRAITEAEEAAKRGATGVWDKIPAADQSAISQAKGVLDEAKKLEDKFINLGGTAFTYQAAKHWSGTKANEIKKEAQSLARAMTRLVDKGTLSDADNAVWEDITQGNWNSKPIEIATFIGNARRQLGNINLSKLEGFETAITQGTEGLKAGIRESLKESRSLNSNIPEGAVPTGRTYQGRPAYRLPNGTLWAE